MSSSLPHPRWMTSWLRCAGVYNLLWGLWAMAFPDAFFDLAGMPRLNHPEIWQCVGMIVGVYGVGYWIAASDPYTHWPVIWVGLLGKVFGPMGYVMALLRGTFTWKAGLVNVTNDLIWWVPFGIILWRGFVYRKAQNAAHSNQIE